METNEPKVRKKRQVNPDRIVLETTSVEFVKSIAAQIEQAFGGVIKLTNKEVANFILQSRQSLLSSSELMAVKEKYFDDVRAAQWAVQKLKAAKDAGESISLAEILSQLQTPYVSEKRASKRRKEKPKSGANDPVLPPIRPMDMGPD